MIVVHDVEVEVTTVLEEPPGSNDVESITMFAHDGTALAFVHEVAVEDVEVLVEDSEVLPLVTEVGSSVFVGSFPSSPPPQSIAQGTPPSAPSGPHPKAHRGKEPSLPPLEGGGTMGGGRGGVGSGHPIGSIGTAQMMAPTDIESVVVVELPDLTIEVARVAVVDMNVRVYGLLEMVLT